ncbi:serine/threonine-protein phosphatase 4 regulatory subunit 3-B-like isoform X2 [Schistocerca gregaria]|uniref:serine/threonine-protein phosphatase 4 regulatory subunit 3-B-like isoform X2 n=1 Tax=Schistocerca gregaria TaxID=7010 RepID=UPI00211DC9CC|nr:serine/threonine-protein phosphatase 4 regulatory subunit 3-B-like isoform X2 [Schistocerca gregaria]
MGSLSERGPLELDLEPCLALHKPSQSVRANLVSQEAAKLNWHPSLAGSVERPAVASDSTPPQPGHVFDSASCEPAETPNLQTSALHDTASRHEERAEPHSSDESSAPNIQFDKRSSDHSVAPGLTRADTNIPPRRVKSLVGPYGPTLCTSAPRRLAKIYKLNLETGWEDRGVGYVDIQERNSPSTATLAQRHFFVVFSTTDEFDVVFESRIPNKEVCEYQKSTLIVWNASGNRHEEYDSALSFQSASDCLEVWNELLRLYEFDEVIDQHYHCLGGTKEVVRPSDENEGDAAGQNPVGEEESSVESHDEQVDSQNVKLPQATLKNVDEILSLLKDATNTKYKRSLGFIIASRGYLPELCDLFRMAEDVMDTDVLHKLFEVFKHLILLSSPELLSQMFCEEHVFQVVGALEYDPKHLKKVRHRKYLKRYMLKNQTVRLSKALEEKIYRAFRIQYTNYILMNYLDEDTFALLTWLICVTCNQIVQHILEEKVLDQVFDRLFRVDQADELKGLLQFLYRLCHLMKSLDTKQNSLISEAFDNGGILTHLHNALRHENFEVRLIATDLILATTRLNVDTACQWWLANRGDRILFEQLIRILHEDRDEAICQIVLTIFKCFLNSNLVDADATLHYELTNLFFSDSLNAILRPMTEYSCDVTGLEQDSKKRKCTNYPAHDQLLFCHLLDFMSFLLIYQPLKTKAYLYNHALLSHCIQFLKCSDKTLILASLRFFRQVIELKDRSLNNQILANHWLFPVVELFLYHRDKCNLINSAALELFNWIINEKMNYFVFDVMSRYEDRLRDVEHTTVFETMRSICRGRTLYGLDKQAESSLYANHFLVLPKSPNFSNSQFYKADKFYNEMEQSDYFESDDDGFYVCGQSPETAKQQDSSALNQTAPMSTEVPKENNSLQDTTFPTSKHSLQDPDSSTEYGPNLEEQLSPLNSRRWHGPHITRSSDSESPSTPIPKKYKSQSADTPL